MPELSLSLKEFEVSLWRQPIGTCVCSGGRALPELGIPDFSFLLFFWELRPIQLVMPGQLQMKPDGRLHEWSF